MENMVYRILEESTNHILYISDYNVLLSLPRYAIMYFPAF